MNFFIWTVTVNTFENLGWSLVKFDIIVMQCVNYNCESIELLVNKTSISYLLHVIYFILSHFSKLKNSVLPT